ncbi:MAG: hypothetical protein H8E12_14690 [Rhodobacteraceae bacterium]|nr:hypothetical protein [Paracoccaceae bacterium]
MPETNPLYTFYDQYNNLLNPEDLNNLQPIFHKPIDQHLGIQISGRFLTTDATANGDMSYITVARNPNLYAAHDGYGLAWRKQPEHLLQVATAQTSANPTSALTALSDDIKNKFFSDYNKTVFEALADAQSTGIDIKDNKAYLKYNVYLIDNDILKEEV